MGLSQFNSASGVLIDGVQILSGTVDLNGTANALILDADGDTHISAPTANQIDISVNGADDFTFTSNSFNVLTGSTIAGPTSTFGTFIPIATEQTLTGAGAINITSFHSKWETTAADAGSLADGVVKGHLKKITMTVDGGDGTLTPTNLSGASTITFANVGDYVLLYFNGTAWVVIETGNIVSSGALKPVVA